MTDLTTKMKTGRARRMAELFELADGLYRSGLMSKEDYEKITAKHVDLTKPPRQPPGS
jgi:hypothetical protein